MHAAAPFKAAGASGELARLGVIAKVVIRKGLAHYIDPNFGISRLAHIYRMTVAARNVLAEIPVALRRLMGRLERGEALFDIRHHAGASPEWQLLHASNRLAFALIVASIIVALAAIALRSGKL